MLRNNLHVRDGSYNGTDPCGVPSLQCGKPDDDDDDDDDYDDQDNYDDYY